MPDYYYIDLLFDPGERDYGDIIDGCISALLGSECEFKRITFREDPKGPAAFFREGTVLDLGNLRESALAYTEDRVKRGIRFIQFPPWGRAAFECGFRFDEAVMEDVQIEEKDAGSSARDLGLSFLFDNEPGSERIKATLNFWEEYVLTYGDAKTHVLNMTMVLKIVERICNSTRPYFGAMNNEIHLNTDLSLDRLMHGTSPTGNEYLIVGQGMVGRLDLEELKRAGCKWKTLSSGGMIIQFINRWEELKPTLI
jgi:hypothetical protein